MYYIIICYWRVEKKTSHNRNRGELFVVKYRLVRIVFLFGKVVLENLSSLPHQVSCLCVFELKHGLFYRAVVAQLGSRGI